MILEIAQIQVRAGSEHDFETAVKEATPLFRAAKGCHGLELQRCIERPEIYVLMVRWETIEDHTVTFRSSTAFARWRELASPFFEGAPLVQHVRGVLTD